MHAFGALVNIVTRNFYRRGLGNDSDSDHFNEIKNKPLSLGFVMKSDMQTASVLNK